ncbi:hypothetical protein VTL71DRAFT_16250 [Oculimacula yallundae]|uniref:Acyltransferase 3 domain-containing protein n=1 Tax=Oculimacula yallundae TaxID=86028 RepID=A0ABR4CDX5_9HELO
MRAVSMRLPYWDKLPNNFPYISSYITIPRLRKLDLFLLPSFITQNGAYSDGEKKKVIIKRDTDYLDGLRGVAALIVVFQHLIQVPYPAFVNGRHLIQVPYPVYGNGFASTDENWHFMQLPFLRLTYTGGPMVAIFFVISGFALSSKGIQLIRSQSPSLFRVLASTTFRRGVRLWLPSIAVSFIGFLLQRMGLLVDDPAHLADTTFSEEVKSFIAYLNGLVNVYTWKRFRGFYNKPLWTIPMEFRCSMVIFLCLLGLSRTKTMVRIGIELLIIVHASYNDRWDVIPFIGGLLIAEQHWYRKEEAASSNVLLADASHNSTPEQPSQTRRMKMFYYMVLVLGLFISSFPKHKGCQTPGYEWFCKIDNHQPMTEKWRYTSAYGAFLIVISISNLPAVQSIFTTSLASYLGKISFAFYLVHGLVLRALIGPMMADMLVATVDGPEIYFHGVVVLNGALLLLIAIPVADLVWRTVDIPSVELAKWLEKKCAYEEKPVSNKKGFD